ncbi:hypothetical protein [Humisphaera borealis]|uniref:BrnT family toxin n=1 Tax=Humisphaera borealis TaxID=2807512 RepID=A0A7M2WVD6_9BACT|nr:hypothetical protein [Humisphaera borealis]QOV88801.1 hypothetical protein IPV69_21640 [Humisphaera borealis]
MYEFRWIDWNVDHIDEHQVSPREAEYVVNHSRRPWPKIIEDQKRIVWGQTDAGRMLQVVYVLDPDGTVFVIHAMELPSGRKRQYRRRRQ